ncbi:MAG: hypothetical protein A2Z29_07210 [Chloroflexi bacterium RBG_16_56_11]|nr:MAG: hypothetical protein A2Z29_07210 [Chloroflexi bacterium RBG_16_56_11]
MSEHLDTINKALTEHHEIRETVRLTGDSVTDVEALFVLRNAYTGWVQGNVQDLPARQGQLLHTLESVKNGLKRHWGFEEKAIEPLLGEPLMKAFLYEHGEIVRQIDNAIKVLTGTKLDGMERQELLGKKAMIQDAINRALQSIDEHSNHEDLIFKMIKKALDVPST